MPEQGAILLARPDFDPATLYGAYWIGVVGSKARQLGWQVTDLYKKEASSSNFRGGIEQQDPIFVHGVGHGNETMYSVEDEEITLTACQDDQIMKDRIVYLLSCRTAVELGPSMVSKGCFAYLGYRVDFTWIIMPPYDPPTDMYGLSFMAATNAIAISILEGKTALTAYKKGVEIFNKEIDKWSKSEDVEASEMVHWLTWDRDGLVLRGEQSASVVPPGGSSPVRPKLWALPLGIGIAGVGIVLSQRK